LPSRYTRTSRSRSSARERRASAAGRSRRLTCPAGRYRAGRLADLCVSLGRRHRGRRRWRRHQRLYLVLLWTERAGGKHHDFRRPAGNWQRLGQRLQFGRHIHGRYDQADRRRPVRRHRAGVCDGFQLRRGHDEGARLPASQRVQSHRGLLRGRLFERRLRRFFDDADRVHRSAQRYRRDESVLVGRGHPRPLRQKRWLHAASLATPWSGVFSTAADTRPLRSMAPRQRLAAATRPGPRPRSGNFSRSSSARPTRSSGSRVASITLNNRYTFTSCEQNAREQQQIAARRLPHQAGRNAIQVR
jgi:hypothetical protein